MSLFVFLAPLRHEYNNQILVKIWRVKNSCPGSMPSQHLENVQNSSRNVPLLYEQLRNWAGSLGHAFWIWIFLVYSYLSKNSLLWRVSVALYLKNNSSMFINKFKFVDDSLLICAIAKNCVTLKCGWQCENQCVLFNTEMCNMENVKVYLRKNNSIQSSPIFNPLPYKSLGANWAS